MNKRIKKMVAAGMLILSVCFLFCANMTNARASELTYGNGMAEAMYSAADDIPEEITQPIERGKQLMAYLVISLGGLIALIGIVFLGIAFLGHQQEMKLQGFIFLGVGVILFAGPLVINWILGGSIF